MFASIPVSGGCKEAILAGNETMAKRRKSNKVRFGVLGLGVMGARHAQWIHDGANRDFCLSAVSTRRKEVAEPIGEKLGVPYFTDAREMFESGLCDAVLVATPHYWHPHHTIRAARSGLHVLVEKPLASAIGPAEAMIAECKKRKVALAVMYQYRTRAMMKKMKQIIDSGRLGELYRATLFCSKWYRTQAYYDSGSWRGTWDGEGGGILLNQASHHLDVFQWLAGMPKRVTGFLSTRLHRIEVENTADVVCEYDGGKIAYIYTTTAGWPGMEKFEFWGDKGIMICEDGRLRVGTFARPISKYLFEYKENRADYIEGPAVRWREIQLPEEPRFQHMNIVRNFAAHLLRGEALAAPGKEAINELMLSSAAYLSADKGRPVELPVDARQYERFLARMERKHSTGRGRGIRAKAQRELRKLTGSQESTHQNGKNKRWKGEKRRCPGRRRISTPRT